MLNIISRSILEESVRGPQKVVKNLIAGLEKVGCPYILNYALDSTNQLWIHDDISALSQIKSLPIRVQVVIGPNLFVNPEDIPLKLDLSRAIYLQPSENVKTVWQNRGMRKTRLFVWPSGVDTDEFKPSNVTKKFVLVYFKNRKEEELQIVIKELTKNEISYRLIRYGFYREVEYKQLLSESRYILWLGCPESQGLALGEALASDTPVLVIDEGQVEYGAALTAAPYFSEICGRKITSLFDFPAALKKMELDWQNFKPRQFILENLNLKKQAEEFIKLFGTTDNKLYNHKKWKNAKWWFRFYLSLREMIKSLV